MQLFLLERVKKSKNEPKSDDFPAHTERKVCKLNTLGYNGQQNKKSESNSNKYVSVSELLKTVFFG